ncbi:MFS transporter [Kitasatospora sp. NPDC001540]|uniref:MFS transporter n=1 Tax=Kitasatospora sp. NPDC001540 TaxID=3364014 RepID=UPI00369C8E51
MPPAQEARVPVRSFVVLAALTVALFSYGTVESLPVGLLPQIAGSLGTTPSAVGLLVTGYGIVVMVTSVPLTGAVRGVHRRRLLGALLTVFTLATSVCALSGSYGTLLGARIAIALTHAVFWSVIASTAAGQFPERHRARVIAALFSGSSLAGVAGVPAGTYLGQQFGWRVPFLVMSVLALGALAAVVVCVPSGPPEAGSATRSPHPSPPQYAVLLTALLFTVSGVFTFFTYITLYLSRVTHLSSGRIGTVLLLIGLAGLAGTQAAGQLASRGAVGTFTGALLGLAAACGLLGLVGGRPVPATLCLALLGASLAAMTTALQARIMQVAPGDTDTASAGGSAVFNAGIAAGSYLGSLLVGSRGPASLAPVGFLLCLLGLLTVTLGSAALARRPVAPPVLLREE